MKNRYSGYQTPSKAARLKPVLVIVLVLAAAFAIFRFAGVGGVNETNLNNQRSKLIRSEVSQAVSGVHSLSRLGASTSSGMLGRVRQYVHGVEVINELNVGLYGEIGRLYSQSMFDNIYAIIDEYELRLSSGQKVSDTLTALSEALEELSARTEELLN